MEPEIPSTYTLHIAIGLLYPYCLTYLQQSIPMLTFVMATPLNVSILIDQVEGTLKVTTPEMHLKLAGNPSFVLLP